MPGCCQLRLNRLWEQEAREPAPGTASRSARPLVDLTPSARRSDDEVIAGLVAVRGIGKWTAEMFLMFELRRLDVWPVEDLGVRQGYGVAWVSTRRHWPSNSSR